MLDQVLRRTLRVLYILKFLNFVFDRIINWLPQWRLQKETVRIEMLGNGLIALP